MRTGTGPSHLAREDEHRFRAVLGHFATGVAVVTAVDSDGPVGLTVQSFCSLSLSPPLVLLCPGLASTSWPRIRAVGMLAINLLAENQADLARKFAQSRTDKYTNVPWTPAPLSGSPILDGVLAWIDCSIDEERAAGDHFVVVCRVLNLDARLNTRPLIFFQSGFNGLRDTGASRGR